MDGDLPPFCSRPLLLPGLARKTQARSPPHAPNRSRGTLSVEGGVERCFNRYVPFHGVSILRGKSTLSSENEVSVPRMADRQSVGLAVSLVGFLLLFWPTLRGL